MLAHQSSTERLDACALLSKLITIPSPNPSGNTVAIAQFIGEYLSHKNVSVQILAPQVKPEAQSVIATVGSGEPVIMLHAHIDTVPIATEEAKRWLTDPYEPTIKDGYLYGKGAVDDKACLAFMMTSFMRCAEHLTQGTLVLVAAAEEEVGGQLGTRYLAEQGYIPEADFIIVGEQTHNHIGLAHKGVMRARIQTNGKSVHATNPDRGVNAIVAMSRVIQAFEAYHAQLRQTNHALVGSPTCNIGTIRGGSTTNAVPDTCEITIDRRMIPKEDPEAVKREIKAIIDALDVAPANVQVDNFLFSSWFESDLSTPLASLMLAAMEKNYVKNLEPTGYLPGSDAKHLMTLARGDMIIFGPGSYEHAHSENECVEISEVVQAEAILDSFLTAALMSH